MAASLDAGARVVVSEQEAAPPAWVTVVGVDQARLALPTSARSFTATPAGRLTLVGTTGTNGNTSTTYILEAILAAGCPVGVIGTVNYWVGESPGRPR